MTADQLLDWLALCEVDDFTPARGDMRAAVASMWNRGASMEKLPIRYPFIKPNEDSDEDMEFIIALLEEQERQKKNG